MAAIHGSLHAEKRESEIEISLLVRQSGIAANSSLKFLKGEISLRGHTASLMHFLNARSNPGHQKLGNLREQVGHHSQQRKPPQGDHLEPELPV
jgi:hypothetical protein